MPPGMVVGSRIYPQCTFELFPQADGRITDTDSRIGKSKSCRPTTRNATKFPVLRLNERVGLFSRIELAIALHKAISGLDTSLFRVQESCRLRPEVPVALGRSRQASMASSLR
jgi:hypothetical protein